MNPKIKFAFFFTLAGLSFSFTFALEGLIYLEQNLLDLEAGERFCNVFASLTYEHDSTFEQIQYASEVAYVPSSTQAGSQFCCNSIQARQTHARCSNLY